MSGRIPEGPLVTFEHIVAALQQVQVDRGAVVYVHSSLSSMGYVQGGADAVIDAFLDVVGPQGTLCVPTIVYAGRGPRPPFDVARSPSEVGRITETLRLRPEARRSDNPTHSVAAIGRQADEITAGHAGGEGRPSPWGELAFGHESPWQRFYDLDAICVLLGVDWEVNTMFHYIQSRFIEPYWSEFATAPPYPYFDRTPMGRELEGAGIVRTSALGSATVTAVSAPHGGSEHRGAAPGSGAVLRGRRAGRLRSVVSRHPRPEEAPVGGGGAAADHRAARSDGQRACAGTAARSRPDAPVRGTHRGDRRLRPARARPGVGR